MLSLSSQVLDRMPLDGSDTVSIVTCDADLSKCKAASQGGVSLYSSEYLLSGILRQQLDPESYPFTKQQLDETQYCRPLAKGSPLSINRFTILLESHMAVKIFSLLFTKGHKFVEKCTTI